MVGVFLLCMCVGIIAGSYIKSRVGDADAASTNITVTNNNQIVTEDQGTPTIVRTSTVTIKDTSATLGYTLSAKVTTNSIPNSTITIYSPTSATCTQSSPCTLPIDNGTGTLSPLEILTVPEPTATQAAGHTTQWTVTITLPQNTPQGNYILDISYTEDGKYPKQCPVLTGKTYLQDITQGTLSTHGTDRERVVLKDRRNNQDYYVQNIVNADGSCLAWMETNLRYGGDGSWNASWNYPDDRYATTTANAANTANPDDNTRPLTVAGTSTYENAQYANPGGSTDYTNTTANGGFYGYLYNWCAAMGGQATACQRSTATQPDQNVSICPAGWRLPIGGNSGEYQSLNTAINSGSNSNDAGLRTNFLAVYSGRYDSSLNVQGSFGYYWSSSVSSASIAYYLYFYATGVYPAGSSVKNYGFAVRCVL